jgi:hypothetical protein
MVHASPGLDSLVRQAFGLIIDIRHHGEAARSLALTISFLRMMASHPSQDAPPFLVSVTAVPIHDNNPESTSKPRLKHES